MQEAVTNRLLYCHEKRGDGFWAEIRHPGGHSYKVIDNVYTIVYTDYRGGDDFMQATIQKWGNSQGIRIPKAFLDALGMVENDLVELNRVEDNIVITKVKKEKEITLEDIFKDYDGEYKAEEFDWGSSVGKEVW